MITIERHPNLDNWLEVKYFGKLLINSLLWLKRINSDAEAKKKKTQVVSSYDGFNGNKRHLVE